MARDNSEVARRFQATADKFRAAMEHASARMETLADALENFNYAMYVWPDEVIEDVLDAEFIG